LDKNKLKPTIRNVVTTSDLKQKINIIKLNDYGWGTYDQAIYGGRCGYIKTPQMKGSVSIFASGKMISMGAVSILKSKRQIHEAKFYLLKEKIIKDLRTTSKVQNIVFTLNFETKLNLKKLQIQFKNSVYKKEEFPGLIVKYGAHVGVLIFSSGKMVIAGAKSNNEIFGICSWLMEKLIK
jgi:transcription initiation factor TFIID TATA-box-binding protein